MFKNTILFSCLLMCCFLFLSGCDDCFKRTIRADGPL